MSIIVFIPSYTYWSALVLAILLMVSTSPSYSQARKDSALSKIDSLKPVIVRPTELRPRIKGDTLEYNTGSLVLRINANVEELLSRLPGLHIDANGRITYNGEVIKQLLVDGEDIFAGDPTMVTRNFDASRIARVQLLDRKSDKALFSGVDDGTRTKTLNLILKEDSKRGYFGKVEPGANIRGTYDANGLLASFNGKEQLVLIGLASNTNKTAVSNNSGNAADGTISFGAITDAALGASAGVGVSRVIGSALHYANKWNEDMFHVSSNYQYGNVLTSPESITTSIQNIPDSVYTQYKKAQSKNQQNTHSGYGVYDWKLNNWSSLRINYRYDKATGNNQYSDTSSSTFNDNPVNTSLRNVNSESDKQNVVGIVSWRLQSKRNPERIVSLTSSLTDNSNTSDGFIYSVNRYYRPDGSTFSLDTVDQRKKIEDRTLRLSGGGSLTQPIHGKNVMGLTYTINYARNELTQLTYNKGDGKYENLVDSLSSNLKGYVLTHNAGLTFQHNAPGLSYTMNAGGQFYTFQQDDVFTKRSFSYHYFNFNPGVIVRYTPKPALVINFSYNGSAQIPDINQLQSPPNNNDPIHITLGNAQLKPGFNQGAAVDFSWFKKIIFNFRIGIGTTSNAISTKTIIDSLGRQISQPFNVDGGRNASLSGSVSKKIGKTEVGTSGNIGFRRNVNFVNADLNRSDSYTKGMNFFIRQFVEGKYSIQINTSFTHSSSTSSINLLTPLHYWSQLHTFSLSVFSIHNYELNTNATYTWQQKSSSFDKDQSTFWWGAFLSRNFMANRLVAKFSVNNILDEHFWNSRTVNGNLTTESSANLQGRYWLLSFAWRFDHKNRNK